VLLVTDENIFLRQIFRSLRGVQLFETTPAEGLPQQAFDLYVFDGWLPDPLPEGGDLLIINPPAGTAFFHVGESRVPSGTITANRDDPRTRNFAVFLDEVQLTQFSTLTDVRWGTTLVSVDGFPLVVAGEVDERQVVILPFDARYPNTDLVLQPAWPILIAELASWYSPPRVLDTSAGLPPGTPVTIRFIENADEAVVIRPDGERVDLAPETSEAVFADTLQPGLYRVELRRDGATVKSEAFAINLFDPVESRIAPERSVTVGSVTISRDAREETGRREFWPWVAALALLVLLVEWWMYHRSLQRIPRVTLSGLRGGERAGRKGLRALFQRRGRRPTPRYSRTR
jgi:hypothetical protein